MTDEIAILGCGAIGSWLGLFLAHLDAPFVLIDDDRVEEGNLSTSAFYTQHVGAFKATALAEMMWRKGKARATTHNRTFIHHDLRMLSGVCLVLDCFDNVEARAITCGLNVPVLHVGVSRDRTGAIVWDRDYTLPDGLPRGQEQFCTREVGRNILRFTASVAAGVVENWIETGQQVSCWTTDRLTVVR